MSTQKFMEKHYSPKRDWEEKPSGDTYKSKYRHYNIGIKIPKGIKGVKFVTLFEKKLKAILIYFGCDFIEIEDFDE